MPKNDWMKKSVGVSFHWTSQTTGQDGSRMPYAERINAFDVDRFVSELKNAGVGHCILTLTHAEQYLCYPCAPLEALLPGRTTKRDLLGELAAKLEAAGIRFIAYYNHSCNGEDDPAWKKACRYAEGVAGNLDEFAENICRIVEDIALHLGKNLSGWWFDSAYSVDPHGPHNTISCDMGDWQFPWDRLIDAAKAGNPDCAVAVNSGVGCNYLYTPRQEYYAGETVSLTEYFPPLPYDGMVDHRWITIDNKSWAYVSDGTVPFAQPRFGDEDVVKFVRENLDAGRMTTFNMEIDQMGEINPHSLAQFRRVMKMISSR